MRSLFFVDFGMEFDCIYNVTMLLKGVPYILSQAICRCYLYYSIIVVVVNCIDWRKVVELCMDVVIRGPRKCHNTGVM